MMAKKKVSFHDEMIDRRAADERQSKEAQKERQAKLDEAELERRRAATLMMDSQIKKELGEKEKILQAKVTDEETLLTLASKESISTVTFVPELAFPIHGVPSTIQQVTLRNSSNPLLWTFGDIFRAGSEGGLDFSLLLVKFTSVFYGSHQGRRKIEGLVKSLQETAKTLPEHASLSRCLGSQVESPTSSPILQVLMEPIRGTPLDLVLKQAGALNSGKTVLFLRLILDALGHLHANGVVHRDVSLSSVFVAEDGKSVTLAFPQLSRNLLGK